MVIKITEVLTRNADYACSDRHETTVQPAIGMGQRTGLHLASRLNWVERGLWGFAPGTHICNGNSILLDFAKKLSYAGDIWPAEQRN